MNRELPHQPFPPFRYCHQLFFLALVLLFANTAVASCNAAWTYTIHGDSLFLQSTDTASTNHHYWSFNGVYNTSNQTSFIQVYPNYGTYHICQYVYTPGSNCSDSSCQNITIPPPTSPCHLNTAWTYTTHGDTVYVTASDTNSANHHYWTFGSYTSTSNSLAASYVFAQGGTYRICLHEYSPNSNCVDSFCQNVTVAPISTCTLTASWQSITHGDTVTFYAGASNTAAHYYWNFGDGSPYGTGTQISHVYANAGTYHVCLYDYIPNTNCADSSCHNVTVTAQACHVSAAWTYSIHGDTVFLHSADTLSANNHYWTFGSGTTYISGTNVYHVFPNYGVNRICLHVYTPGTLCNDSSCNTITLPYPCHVNAAWTYSNTAGNNVHFFAADTSLTVSRLWTFGDGTSNSFTSSPVKTYSAPGTYHVCLRVYGAGSNCVDSFCSTITVGTACNVTAGWQATTHLDTAHFYTTSNGSAASYSWKFGDGHTGTGIYPTHVYAQGGTYHVCLYVSVANANCVDSFCSTVTIASGCHVSAAWTYTIHGDTVFLHSSDTLSANHHYWSFNGVYSTANQTSLMHVYTGPGVYRICQYVYTPGTSCVDSSCNTITIANTCNVHAAFQFYTVRDSVHFYNANNDSTVHLDWNFGDGNFGFGTNPWHEYPTAGTYHVCCYAYTAGCLDSFCTTVTVGGGCHVSAAWTYTIHGDTVFLHSVDTLSTNNHYWTFGTPNYSSGTSVTHIFTGLGTYHVCLHVYTPGTTCSDSSCNTITIANSCLANAAWTYTVSGNVVHYHATDTTSSVYLDWNYGDGSYNFGQNTMHTYAQPGTYHVCLYAYTGTTCIDSFCNTVTVGSGCHVSATWSYTVHGDSVFLRSADTLSANHHYWIFDGNTSTYASGTSVTNVFNNIGSHHVCLYVYTPGTNCADSSCNNITITNPCNVHAIWQSYVTGDSAHFFAGGNTGASVYYNWHFGDGHSGTGTNPVHEYAQAGTYHVCLYAYNSTNCIDSFCNTITIAGGCNITSSWTYMEYGDSVHFISADTNHVAHHYWNFGDGHTGSGFDISHVYSAPGIYNVCSYVYIPGTNCVDSTCNTITVSGSCSITAAVNFINVAHDTVAFYALFQDSATNFIWIYGDGTTSSGAYAVHGYPVPGTYHVCLHAFIPGTPCYDSVCLDINVGNQCAVTAAWASIPRGNDSVQFYAADPDTNAIHTWNFGDGSTTIGSYAAHTFAASGTYHVCLFVSVPNTTCSDSLCKDINAIAGINDLATAYPTISLRPNPFSQYAIMNIDGPASNYEVHIYDMIGQEVRTVSGVNNSIMIDRGTLASGIYTYAVTADKMIIGKGKMSIE